MYGLLKQVLGILAGLWNPEAINAVLIRKLTLKHIGKTTEEPHAPHQFL